MIFSMMQESKTFQRDTLVAIGIRSSLITIAPRRRGYLDSSTLTRKLLLSTRSSLSGRGFPRRTSCQLRTVISYAKGFSLGFFCDGMSLINRSFVIHESCLHFLSQFTRLPTHFATNHTTPP